MIVRAICDTFGVADPGNPDAPLGPLLPPVVQVNVDEGLVKVGDVLHVTVRVVVRQLIPAPLPPV